MNKGIFIFLLFYCFNLVYAQEQEVLNIYIFGNYIPNEVINQFVRETGVKVNVVECENNENLITKINTSPNFDCDVATFSSYFLPVILPKLQQLDYEKLDNLKIHPYFMDEKINPSYLYNLPFCWGTTGIIINSKYFNQAHIKNWNDLWLPKYRNQLMILNDMRELFSTVLISLGYSVNDDDPEHLEEAYKKILKLIPNIRVINLECVPNVYIDEDVLIGTAWSGDFYLANKENKDLKFINPEPGFVLWYDSLVILQNAPHKENAYKFLNFINRPDIVEKILDNGYYTTNEMFLRQIFSPNELDFLLKNGQLQYPLSANVKKIYEAYWNKIRLE